MTTISHEIPLEVSPSAPFETEEGGEVLAMENLSETTLAKAGLEAELHPYDHQGNRRAYGPETLTQQRTRLARTIIGGERERRRALIRRQLRY